MLRERVCNVILIGVVMAGAAVVTSAAGTTGTLTVNGKKTALTTAVAFSYPSVTGPGKNISVLISDKAPQDKVFRDLMMIGPGEKLVPGLFEGAWRSMHDEKAFEGLSFTFAPDKRLLTNDVLVGGRDKFFSLSTYDLTVDLKAFGPRISGTIRTSSPVEAPGITCAFDVTFDAAVVDFK